MSERESKFRTNVENSKESMPEEKLLRSMLERAVLDTGLSDYRIKRDAVKWITANRSEDEDWSFFWVCRQLRLSSVMMKRIIIKTKNVSSS